MKLRYKVASTVLLLTAIVSCITLIFKDDSECEYALIITNFSMLMIILSVIIFAFGKRMRTAAESAVKRKRVFVSLMIALPAFAILLTTCEFISCYDGYVPESLYVTDKEYIQAFFPAKDISKIKYVDELYNDGRLEYSNFPGTSSIEVNSFDRAVKYEMNYIKTQSPTLNLRSYIRKYYKTHFDPYGVNENFSSCSIEGVKIETYHDDYTMIAYIDNFNEHLSISISNYKKAIPTQNELAQLAYDQLTLARNAVETKRFREKPWYDIMFYLKEWNEPYEKSEYFL